MTRCIHGAPDHTECQKCPKSEQAIEAQAAAAKAEVMAKARRMERTAQGIGTASSIGGAGLRFEHRDSWNWTLPSEGWSSCRGEVTRHIFGGPGVATVAHEEGPLCRLCLLLRIEALEAR